MEQVQNAIDFLTMIGALDEKENLTNLGESVPVQFSWLFMSLSLFSLVIVDSLFYCHLLSIREVSLDTSCRSQAGKNADNGSYISVL